MKHLLLRSIVLAGLTLGIASVASAGTVKVSIHDGRVTILAEDVSVRQILDEWSRVGQTRMVNADKVFGPTVTLQLVDVPEREALDTLLRSVSGYIAAPRQAALANASMYDRITIMATSHAPAMSAVASAVPTFQRPPMPQDDEDAPVNVMVQQQLERAQELARQQQLQRMQQPASPVLTPYPGMQPPPQGQQGMPTSSRPGIPVTTSPVPGAPPQQIQPGGAGNPYQPIQPSVVRPVGPGGGGGGN